MVTNEIPASHLGTLEWPLTGSEKIPKNTLKALRERSNLVGLIHLAVHLLALLATGSLIYLTQGSWLIIAAWFLHGTVMVLLFAPLHECSHGTAFRKRWMNLVVGILAGALTMRPFFYFKYRHADHHTYTQHKNLDPDIVPFPHSIKEYVLLILGVSFWPKLIGTLWRGTIGRFTPFEMTFIPKSDVRRVSGEIRFLVVLYAAVAVASVAFQSWAVVIYWLVPRVLGEPVLRAIRMAEHTGTQESPNLLANTRTVTANPVFRMLYWNMSYHAEHHLSSSIPFHALRRLHAEVRPYLLCVSTSYWAVHRDILSRIAAERRVRRFVQPENSEGPR